MTRQNYIIPIIVVMVMSTWMVVPSIAPQLALSYGITLSEIAFLTVAVQVGFVIGAYLISFLRLADRLSPQRLMGFSALVAAASTLVLVIDGGFLAWAIVFRLCTGFALAGVYPPAVRLLASWSQHGRGSSIGILIGALTLGSALPSYLTSLFGAADINIILILVSMLSLCGAVLSFLFLKLGPHAEISRGKNSISPKALIKNKEYRFLLIAYTLHMWELYTVWAWFPQMLSETGIADSAVDANSLMVVTFVAQGIFGLFGAVVAGKLGDRVGYLRVAIVAMFGSAISGAMLMNIESLSMSVKLVLAVIWGAMVIADSALLSAAVTKSATKAEVGSAVSLQTSVGFLATAISIPTTKMLSDEIGWGLSTLTLSVASLAGGVVLVLLLNLRKKKVDQEGLINEA